MYSNKKKIVEIELGIKLEKLKIKELLSKAGNFTHEIELKYQMIQNMKYRIDQLHFSW